MSVIKLKVCGQNILKVTAKSIRCCVGAALMLVLVAAAGDLLDCTACGVLTARHDCAA